MSTLEAPPALPSAPPEPPESSSPPATLTVRVAGARVSALSAPSTVGAFARRALLASVRLAGRGVWMVTRWTVTVALVGGALGTGALVAGRSASHLVRHSATAVPPKPITFEPLATRSVVYAR